MFGHNLSSSFCSLSTKKRERRCWHRAGSALTNWQPTCRFLSGERLLEGRSHLVMKLGLTNLNLWVTCTYVYRFILPTVCLCVDVCPPVTGDTYRESAQNSGGTRGWQLDAEAGEALIRFPRASVMHINHISRLYYLKITTLLWLIRDKGLTWQEYCIGESGINPEFEHLEVFIWREIEQ